MVAARARTATTLTRVADRTDRTLDRSLIPVHHFYRLDPAAPERSAAWSRGRLCNALGRCGTSRRRFHPANARSDMTNENSHAAVYVQTNDAKQNEVLVFE